MFYSVDTPTQDHLKQGGWAGSFEPTPLCNTSQACISDSFGVVEANLSVNKISQLIKRSFSKSLSLGVKGENHATDTITLQNTTAQEDKNAGAYTTYLRLYYPKTTAVKSIRINNVVVSPTESSMSAKPIPYVEKIEEKPSFNTFGVALVVNPKETATVVVDSSLDTTGNSYAFSWIHQPGTGVIPVVVSATLPATWTPSFSYQKAGVDSLLVAKQGFFEYTTRMSTNNSFVVDFKKP
jgi:hypothetical protein